MTKQLLNACLIGDLDAVQTILQNNRVSIDAKDKGGFTALMEASYKGHVDIARLLIQNGANVNATTWNDGTALIIASNNGHIEIVRLLLENGANVNAKDHDGYTALIGATYAGYTDIIGILVDYGAELDNQTTLFGDTALIIASRNGNLEIVRIFIYEEANIDIKNHNGKSAIDYAYENKYHEIIEILGGHPNIISIPITSPKIGNCNLCYDDYDCNLQPQYTCSCKFKLICEECIMKCQICPWCRNPISDVIFVTYDKPHLSR